MPNQSHERQEFRAAGGLIVKKYTKWLEQHPDLPVLFASDTEFDLRVKFMDDEPFKKNLQLSSKPQSNCTVLGFTDFLHGKPTIYINRDQYAKSTLIHELLHFFTHKNFNDNISGPLNEGVTEYFTRKVQGNAPDVQQFSPFKVARTAYKNEYESVVATRKFIKDILVPGGGTDLGDPGWDDALVKRAYFQGDLAMIKLLKENSSLKFN